MNVVGLVTEYNPFHLGHKLHINESKKITNSQYSIAVMSGNYVQRGEPAFMDKWTRTKLALMNGIDIVIEIPVHFSTSSAEFFSSASIALLESTGIVDSVCFGSESGNLSPLNSIADILVNEPNDFKKDLNEQLNKGVSFPTARSIALKKYISNEDAIALSSPNNILGIEYIKALKKQNSKIKPYTIQRVGSGYHDKSINNNIVSASAIRRYIESSKELKELVNMVPENCYDLIVNNINKNMGPIDLEDFFTLFKYQLTILDVKELSQIFDITEGLDKRFLNLINSCSSMDEFIKKASTKRFTTTKIQRAILHTILNIKTETVRTFKNNGYAQYIKVLGFRSESRQLMKLLKKNAKLPIIVNVKDSKKQLTSLQNQMLEDEIRATNIYNIALYNKMKTTIGNDYSNPIIII